MAIEDGAVLGELFSKLTNALQVPAILSTYERLRKPRTTRVVQGSLKQGGTVKLHDGDKQRERDHLLTMPGLDEYPVPITSPKFRDWLQRYDAFAEVKKAWKGGESG